MPRIKHENTYYSDERKCLVIPTYNLEKRFPILKNCINSIDAPYGLQKIIVVNGVSSCDSRYSIPDWIMIPNPRNGQEIGAIERTISFFHMKELFLLHDTCEIKDNSLWDKVFIDFMGKNVAIAPKYLMLIGKYMVDNLITMRFPDVRTKREGHELGEHGFIWKFIEKFPYETLCPEFIDENALHEEKWGRDNLKLVCPYMIKWKGSWSLDHLVKGGVDATV